MCWLTWRGLQKTWEANWTGRMYSWIALTRRQKSMLSTWIKPTTVSANSCDYIAMTTYWRLMHYVLCVMTYYNHYFHNYSLCVCISSSRWQSTLVYALFFHIVLQTLSCVTCQPTSFHRMEVDWPDLFFPCVVWWTRPSLLPGMWLLSGCAYILKTIMCTHTLKAIMCWE